jgi:hypothetical protein
MTQISINLSQKLLEIISWFFGHYFFTVCFKIGSYLNYYTLCSFIFILILRWILPSRLIIASFERGLARRASGLNIGVALLSHA